MVFGGEVRGGGPGVLRFVWHGDWFSFVRVVPAVSFKCFVFFFQAEDGIRDVAVTGVQTCALPILARAENVETEDLAMAEQSAVERVRELASAKLRLVALPVHEAAILELDERLKKRSEERRVGKECRSGWAPYH